MFEQDKNVDFKLFYTILHASCYLFVMQPGARKRFLYQALAGKQIL